MLPLNSCVCGIKSWLNWGNNLQINVNLLVLVSLDVGLNFISFSVSK
jgi:hypothetical protein